MAKNVTRNKNRYGLFVYVVRLGTKNASSNTPKIRLKTEVAFGYPLLALINNP
jgi:hypothetical protein